MHVAARAQLFERLARARVRIAEHRCRQRLRRVVERQQVGAVARLRVAFGLRDRLRRLGIALHEARVEERDDRDVEAVEPHHRLIARVAVVVPRPGRRDDEVAGMHRDALAVDRGIRAGAFDHEAQRRLRVAVARRDFAGHDELQAGIEAVRDRRSCRAGPDFRASARAARLPPP